jgi:hypothetical protein
MALVSQRAYGRHRGISQAAVWKRTTAAGGPIPTHGPKKLIDVAEADALWDTTMSPQGAGNAQVRADERRIQARSGAAAGSAAARARQGTEPASVRASALSQARAAALVVDVQVKRLALEQKRGALISRDRAVLRCFTFARMLRDRWLAWPTRVGPLLAAQFEVDATALTVVLEGLVREHLAELARESPEF